jgi:hypothetical protein
MGARDVEGDTEAVARESRIVLGGRNPASELEAPGHQAAVLALQRTAGNANVVRLLGSHLAPARRQEPTLEDVLAAHARAHAEHRIGSPFEAAGGLAAPRLVRGVDAHGLQVARWAAAGLTEADEVVLARDDKSAHAAKAQSCMSSESDDALIGPEAEQYAEQHDIHLTPPDGEKEMPVGYKPHFRQTSREGAGNQGNYQLYNVRKWHVKGPSDKEFRSKPDWGGSRFSIEMDEAGDWLVAAEMHVDGQKLYLIRRQTIVAEKGFADEAFQTAGTANYVNYRMLMNQERLNRGGAVLDQSTTTGAYISNEGPEAANPAPVKDVHGFTYLVHPDARVPQDRKPLTYRWWAIPRQTNMDNFKGRIDLGVARTEYKGEFAFYLGEGERRSFRRDESATVEIVCEVIGSDGKLVDTARYQQVIMREEDLKKVRQLEKMESEGAAAYRKIQADKASGLKAMHLDARRGKTEDLTLFYGPSAADAAKTMLVDLTPGAEYVEHPGANLGEALKHLEANNSYAAGEILVQVDAEPQPRRLKTKGESDLADEAGKTGLGSMILIGLGVVAGLIPGVDVAAPFLIAAGLGTGAASGAMSLADELRKSKPSSTKVMLDITAIVGSLMGVGSTIQAVRMGSVELAMATATGRFFIYTGFTFDAAGGILLAADTADRIEQVRNSTTMTEDEKIDAIEKLVLMAAVAGGLIAFGGHDLATARTRITGILGEERLAKLRADQIYTLQALDVSVLAALKKVPADQFEAVASALGKDPRRAAALSKAYGEKFINEVRAHPTRSLEETGEILGAETRGLEVTAVGGTRGHDVYTRDPAKGIGSGKERFKRGVNQTNEGRVHRSTLTNIAVKDDGTAATLELVVGADTVSVTVELKETSKLTPGPHADTGGPGAGRIVELVPPPASGGKWTAKVELDAATAQDDVKFILGHELDEIADFIKTKGAAGIGALTAEGEAGLFVRWRERTSSTGPTVTAHDRANAREYLSVAGDLRSLEAQLAKSPADAALKARVARRRESLTKLTDNMGLKDPQNIELKLATLRESVQDMEGPAKKALTSQVPGEKQTPMDALIDSIQHDVTTTAFRTAVSGVAQPGLTEDLVAHLMRAQPQATAADFIKSGLHGGHHEASLREFIAANPEYALVMRSEASSGGVTYRAYDQYRWNGAPPAPRPGDPRYPTGAGRAAGAIDPGWQRAQYPKTTFDDPTAFLATAEQMVSAFKAKVQAKPGQTLKGPLQIGSDPDLFMHFDYTPPPAGQTVGTWDIRSIFIDENWIAGVQTAAATPTPVPVSPTPVK